MTLSLKEFTKTLAPLPVGKAVWRKVFPTDLRNKEILIRCRIFRDDITRWELQEQWERVHAGEVIETEWRPIRTVPPYHIDYGW